MKKLTLWTITMILVLSLAMVACSNNPQQSGETVNDTEGEVIDTSSGSGEAVEFKIGHVVAEDHPYHKGMLKFKEIIESNPDLNISVQVFANSQLGGEREMAEALQLGTLDIAIIPGVISSFSEDMGVLDLPYLFKSREEAYKVLDGEIGEQLAEKMPEANGFRLLSYWENGFRNVTNSRREVKQASDLEGITIRVPENRVYQAFFEELGSNVIAMSFSELYTALHQKTIDGQENPVALIATNKLYETQPYLSMTEHFYGPAQVCISEMKWQTLPENIQSALVEAMNEARDYERQLMAESEEGYLKDITDAGTMVTDVDKSSFDDAVQRTYARFPEYDEIVNKIRSGQ